MRLKEGGLPLFFILGVQSKVIIDAGIYLTEHSYKQPHLWSGIIKIAILKNKQTEKWVTGWFLILLLIEMQNVLAS